MKPHIVIDRTGAARLRTGIADYTLYLPDRSQEISELEACCFWGDHGAAQPSRARAGDLRLKDPKATRWFMARAWRDALTPANPTRPAAADFQKLKATLIELLDGQPWHLIEGMLFDLQKWGRRRQACCSQDQYSREQEGQA